MIKLRIVSVGKIKEKYWLSAQAEYLKRMSRYADVELIELQDLPTPQNPSQAERDAILKKEGEGILRAVKGYDITIALAVEGQQMASEAFASKIKSYCDIGKSMCFIIGGSLGIFKDIKDKADILLSFSQFTFPHRLARIVLLEQIYRAFKIMNNENYHK